MRWDSQRHLASPILGRYASFPLTTHLPGKVCFCGHLTPSCGASTRNRRFPLSAEVGHTGSLHRTLEEILWLSTKDSI